MRATAVTNPVPTSQTRRPLSWRKRLVFFLLLSLLLTFTAVIIAEATVRSLGYRPRYRQRFNFTIEPGGSLFVAHPTLGYQSRPGHYRVTMDSRYAFSVTNMENSLRISAPHDRPITSRDEPEIWLFGCSFTYGYAVNDDQSFPWYLQMRMPDYRIVNLGVPAYGTVQGLIQLRQALAAGRRPRAAVVVYFADHDARNSLLRERREILDLFSRLGPITPPYATLVDDQLRITMGSPLYRPFPLVRVSATANALDHAYNEWEKRRTPIHRVTEMVVAEMARVCREHGFALGVAGFSPEPAVKSLLEYCHRHEIPSDNIQYDWGRAENFYWPADGVHSSPLGNQRLADHLECFLKLELLADDYLQRLSDPTRQYQAHVELASAHFKQSRRETAEADRDRHVREAIAHWRLATELDSQQAAAHTGLADALAADSHPDQAQREYRTALELEPESSVAALGLARLMISRSDRSASDAAEALRLAEQACQGAERTDAESLQILARTEAAAGKWDQAIATATRALEIATVNHELTRAAGIDRDVTKFQARIADPSRASRP